MATSVIDFEQLLVAVEAMSLDDRKKLCAKLALTSPASSAKKPKAKKVVEEKQSDEEAEVKEKKTKEKKTKAAKTKEDKKEVPAEPVLKAGWCFKPSKKGLDRWYNEEEDEYTEDRLVCFTVSSETETKAGKKKASPEEKKAKLDSMTEEERAERDRKIKERTEKAKATRAAKKLIAEIEEAEAETDDE